jgi:hypothetical protein
MGMHNLANTARIQSQDSNFEGFVHTSTHIWLGSLTPMTRVLQEKQNTGAGKIVEVTFEEVPGKDYRYHPTIKTFLEETSFVPLISDKRQRVEYCGSSASITENIRASTWFGSVILCCPHPLQIETIFRLENVAHTANLCQEAKLRSADVITFASAGPSGPASAASSTVTVQVDALVHSSKHIQRVTLESWLDPAQIPQVVEFRWGAIQTEKGTAVRTRAIPSSSSIVV